MCDESLRDSKQWACGAKKVDYHLPVPAPSATLPSMSGPIWSPLSPATLPALRQAALRCPRHRGSQVFQLGTKYSEAMGATFMDEDGKEKPLIMAATALVSRRRCRREQHNDEHGIVWPVSVAPYEVAVIPLDPRRRSAHRLRADR
ncbi:MAG: hypothetical protein ACLRM9_00615 [Collinsella aerofaciens]